MPNWNVPSGAYKPGETLVDVLTCSTVTADKNGGVLVARLGKHRGGCALLGCLPKLHRPRGWQVRPQVPGAR